MKRSWMVVREGESRTFTTKLVEVAPILKGLARVRKAEARAAYMRKWHELHDLDVEVHDNGEVPEEEESKA